MSIRTPAARFITVLVVFLFFVGIFQHDSADYTFLPKLPLKSNIKSQSQWLRERMSLSETSWQKSVELRESFARSRPSYPQIPFFGKNTFTIWDYFPATWTCPHDIQRVGQMGDGGKWVCGMSVYESLPEPLTPAAPVAASPEAYPGFVIYSFGVNHDSSFEAEMLERIPAARAWGYDFSVDRWGPQISENANSSITSRAFFKKAGLGRTDDTQRNPPFYSLPSIMKQNNHSYIDILKIDIEGHEFEAFDALMDEFEGVMSASGESVLPIGQVMIELHINNLDFMRFKGWWERIEKMGMRPTWMEVNLLAVTLGSQKSNPSCTEYVWVNVKDQRNVLWQL